MLIRTDRYLVPITPVTPEGTQDVVVFNFVGTRHQVRTCVIRSYLRTKFDMTRKQAHQTIRAMGFDDLLCAG